MNKSNEDILVIVHIETDEAVQNIDEIMSVPGIDLAFIGSTDLSVSMGYQKEGASASEVQKAIQKVYDIGQKRNCAVGTVAGNTDVAVSELKKGASYIGFPGTNLISSAFKNTINNVKENNVKENII